MEKKKKTTKKNIPMLNWTVNNAKPENSAGSLRDLEHILRQAENKRVLHHFIKGDGSKYLYVYTTEPAMIVRISDHATGNEDAVEVNSRPQLIVKALEMYNKLK